MIYGLSLVTIASTNPLHTDQLPVGKNAAPVSHWLMGLTDLFQAWILLSFHFEIVVIVYATTIVFHLLTVFHQQFVSMIFYNFFSINHWTFKEWF